MSREIPVMFDRDDLAMLAPILRGRVAEIEHTIKLRSHLLTDFDRRADARYANRIRNCVAAIEEATKEHP